MTAMTAQTFYLVINTLGWTLLISLRILMASAAYKILSIKKLHYLTFFGEIDCCYHIPRFYYCCSGIYVPGRKFQDELQVSCRLKLGGLDGIQNNNFHHTCVLDDSLIVGVQWGCHFQEGGELIFDDRFSDKKGNRSYIRQRLMLQPPGTSSIQQKIPPSNHQSARMDLLFGMDINTNKENLSQLYFS